MVEVSHFEKKLHEHTAAKAAQKPPELPDTLAGLTDGARHRTDADVELDAVIDGISFEDAYRKWCGKMEPGSAGSRTEGIKISCPIPGHADTHPSAWYNSESGLWFCGGCQRGGDKHDLAAWHHGHDVPGYKGPDFPKLRRQMAEDFGFRVRRTAGGTDYISSPEPTAATVPEPGTDQDDSDAVPLNLVEYFQPPELTPLSIDWRSILPSETFLEKWMLTTSADDLPEEYYFWNGLIAVGMAAGRQAVLNDRPLVRPNLFVCLYGPSGGGKTRSTWPLADLLTDALPYDRDDPTSTGTHLVPMTGSAESLIDEFSRPIVDPNNPKKILAYAGVRGLIQFDEMSALMGLANRTGSLIKPHLIQFYDCKRKIDISSRGAGRVVADQHFASALAATQPGAIRKILLQSDADSGFVNRWVFASGPLKPLESYRTDNIDIAPLVQPLQALRQWTSHRFRNIALEPAALHLWDRFFRDTIEPIKVSSEKPLLTRSDLLIKKLILLFCINEQKEIADAALVERVLTLWPYIDRSYELLGSEIGIGLQQDCRNKILDAVHALDRRYNKPPTVAEIVNRIRTNKFEPDLIKRTITVMVALGDIDEIPREGMRGPKSIGYRCA